MFGFPSAPPKEWRFMCKCGVYAYIEASSEPGSYQRMKDFELLATNKGHVREGSEDWCPTQKNDAPTRSPDDDAVDDAGQAKKAAKGTGIGNQQWWNKLKAQADAILVGSGAIEEDMKLGPGKIIECEPMRPVRWGRFQDPSRWGAEWPTNTRTALLFVVEAMRHVLGLHKKWIELDRVETRSKWDDACELVAAYHELADEMGFSAPRFVVIQAVSLPQAIDRLAKTQDPFGDDWDWGLLWARSAVAVPCDVHAAGFMLGNVFYFIKCPTHPGNKSSAE